MDVQYVHLMIYHYVHHVHRDTIIIQVVVSYVHKHVQVVRMHIYVMDVLKDIFY